MLTGGVLSVGKLGIQGVPDWRLRPDDDGDNDNDGADTCERLVCMLVTAGVLE